MSELRSAVYSWPLSPDKNPRLGEKLRKSRYRIQRSLTRHGVDSRKALLERMSKIDVRLWQLTNHEPGQYIPGILGGNPLFRSIESMSQEDIRELGVVTYPLDHPSRAKSMIDIEKARDMIAAEFRRRLQARADDQLVWECRGQEFADTHVFNDFFIQS